MAAAQQLVIQHDHLPRPGPFRRITFLFCPTGRFCRENRCQSFFNFSLIPSMRAPLEECEAAGAIFAAGAQAFLIDAPAEQYSDLQFVAAVRETNADLLVVVCTFGSLAADLNWVRHLRVAFPETAIALRGAPVYVSGRKLLSETTELDFCVKGDYEIIFSQLAQQPLRDVPGVLFRDSNSIEETAPAYAANLDSLPLPERSIVNESLYTVRGTSKAQASVHVQRGCPYSCTYCLVHTVSGKKARHRSPRSIAAEMRNLRDRGISSAYLRAETFTLDRQWALDVCNAIAEDAAGIRWVTTTRAERVDDELLAVMKRAGCYGISFGIDVVPESIAEKVQKPVDLAAARKAFLLCRKHRILSLAYIMIGFYWENCDTLAETSRAVGQLESDLLTIHYAHPYPGTRYAHDIKAENLTILSPRAQAEPAIVTPFVSRRELERAARGMLLRHYLAPRRLTRIALRLSSILFPVISRR